MTNSYRLRAGIRGSDGRVTGTAMDMIITAPDDATARETVRIQPVHFFTDTSDYAWLTDSNENLIWSLKFEEA